MSDVTNNDLLKAMTDISIQVFRFTHVFERAIQQLDPGEHTKYMSQLSWFTKKADLAIHVAGLSIVNLEGLLYDPGMAVTPLNLGDFDISDKLSIVQMIEPIIMRDGEVLHTGTVMLGRIEE